MVDRIERLTSRPRDCLAGHQPNQKAADQSGTSRCSNGVDVGELHLRPRQCLLDQAVERIDMGARRDFRHDAAIGAVLVELAQDHVGLDPAGAGIEAGNDGRGRLVTAGLDAENA